MIFGKMSRCRVRQFLLKAEICLHCFLSHEPMAFPGQARPARQAVIAEIFQAEAVFFSDFRYLCKHFYLEKK